MLILRRAVMCPITLAILGSLFSDVPVRAEVRLSHSRGFYEKPFSLSIESDASSPTIQFSIDGSDPRTDSGTLYEGPISIDRTLSIRVVESIGNTFGPVKTDTFILPSTVWKQPKYPEGLITSARSRLGNHAFDWEMDPELLQTDADRRELESALTSLPALAVTLSKADFNFLYENHQRRGVDFERPVSIELIYPSTDRFESFGGFQIDCGVRMQGGMAVSQARKKSMRLLFKKDYGAGKLKYPIFESAPNQANSAAERFDTLVLRAGGNENWSKEHAWKTGPTTLLRDALVRDSQIAVSGVGSHSTYVHLFLNGLYNGIYNISERPDTKFLATYFGGEPEAYFAINHGGTVDGDRSQWDQVNRGAQGRDGAALNGALAVNAFCDYILLNWLAGVGDWPWNNFYAGMRTIPAKPIRFFSWDAEFAFWPEKTTLTTNQGAWVNPHFLRPGRRASRSPIIHFWKVLEGDLDFRMTFADRVYRQCFGDGPLTDENMLARFHRLKHALEPAIVAESMRWGDSGNGFGDQPRTKKDNWLPNCDKIERSIRENVVGFMKALKRHGFFPNVPAPVLDPVPDHWVPDGFKLRLRNKGTNGTLIYSTNGKDPFGPGGSVAEGALTWIAESSLTIAGATHLKARVLVEDDQGKRTWSALCEKQIFTKPIGVPLRMTEIMFAPADDEAFEFIEIINGGPLHLDLTGFRFSGVDYRFPPGSLIKGHEVIVLIPNDDPEAFLEKYPNATVAGEYRKHLSNDGEQLVFSDGNGRTMDSVTFPSSNALKAKGYSLERKSLLSPELTVGDVLGGSPGTVPATLMAR